MVSVSREIAFKALIQWVKSEGDPHSIISELLNENIKPEDAAFARELFFGTIKFKRKIDYYSSRYYTSKNLELKLKQIIRLSFYQLLQTKNVPDYAVVSESVELAKNVKGPEQGRFVNAVLRNYLRNPDKASLPSRQRDSVKYLGLVYSFPDWLVERYIKRYGESDTEKLLDWFNQPPRLCFFPNLIAAGSGDIEAELKSREITCNKHENFSDYYECLEPHKLIRSELFLEGRIIIGDPAQGLPAKALEVMPGEAALDLFAAPGGKSAALAGMLGAEGFVVASEYSAKRLQLMRHNLKRWNLSNVFLIRADALKFATGRKLRYILADVPCSGTGAMRRNPDMRWRLAPDDIGRLAAKQNKLIRAAANLLAPGGRMVYSTCSLEPEENERVVREFLKHNPDYQLKNVGGLKEFEIETGLYSVAPYEHGSDGAFVAVIERKM